MALLTGYFDESGIHEGDHCCVVAGFVGNDAQWQALAADWIPAIRPRTNLHMKDLRWKHVNRVGPLLAKLGPIPHKYNLKPVFSRILRSDYDSIIKGKIDSNLTNIYVVCAVCCIAEVLANIAGSDEVFFLFDRQEGLRKETMDYLRDTVYGYFGLDSRVKDIQFIPRHTTVCLDPADYLAFEIRERGMNVNSQKAKLGESILGNNVRGYGGRIAPDQLRWMLKGWQEDQADTLENILARLMNSPYFRGPR